MLTSRQRLAIQRLNVNYQYQVYTKAEYDELLAMIKAGDLCAIRHFTKDWNDEATFEHPCPSCGSRNCGGGCVSAPRSTNERS